ncbi:hypothetical protein fHeYen801_023 [Yersinia phage fHe-Yen8-01]|nr:hypothetical protein fHeYen801_023 [Yersinia phage fHe-Yen8-01]
MIKTTISRLLKRLHSAVFDTSAQEVTLFQLSHRAGYSWRVSENVLTVTVGTLDYTYDLSLITVEQLAAWFVLDKFEVTLINPEFREFSAQILVESAGTVEPNFYGKIIGFEDLEHVWMGAFATMIRNARIAVGEALKQMVITTAEGSWLNIWGNNFGVNRQNGMTDDKYQKLIPAEAFRIRVNGLAIEQAIKDITGYEVTIEEPWSDIFRFDISKFSSTAKSYNGGEVGYFLIRPVAFGQVDWDAVMPVIIRNKAAGIEILSPDVRGIYYVNDPLSGNIWESTWSMQAFFAQSELVQRWDEMHFDSGIELAINYRAMITSTQMCWQLNQRILGVVSSTPSNILTYQMQYFGYEIFRNYVSFMECQFVQAYPEAMKTWKDAGTWKGFQTWNKPYEWLVFSNMQQEENKFFCDGTISLTIYTSITSGETWENPPSWDTNDSWNLGDS